MIIAIVLACVKFIFLTDANNWKKIYTHDNINK